MTSIKKSRRNEVIAICHFAKKNMNLRLTIQSDKNKPSFYHSNPISTGLFEITGVVNLTPPPPPPFRSKWLKFHSV